jgi:hypothetical protein
VLSLLLCSAAAAQFLLLLLLLLLLLVLLSLSLLLEEGSNNHGAAQGCSDSSYCHSKPVHAPDRASTSVSSNWSILGLWTICKNSSSSSSGGNVWQCNQIGVECNKQQECSLCSAAGCHQQHQP